MKPAVNGLGQPIGKAVANWQPRPRPGRTAMTGKFCRVETLNMEAHAADLFEAFRQDEEGRIWTYLRNGPFERKADFDLWLAGVCRGEDPLFHAIIELKTNRAVGVAGYLNIEPAIGVIEVGHINYAPVLQRTAAASEAMFLMMARVFDELGYRRYEWKCDSLNEPSRRAAERLGFRYEGLFRQATIYKGRNRDTVWFSILDKEWPALKAAFEIWLADENFDADGVQKACLDDLRQPSNPITAG